MSLDPVLLANVTQALDNLRYGTIQLVIHDGRVVRLERIERIQMTQPTGPAGGSSQTMAELPEPRVPRRTSEDSHS